MRLFIIIAVICFAIALLLATSILSGGNAFAWVCGGLLAVALDLATGYVVPLNRGGGA